MITGISFLLGLILIAAFFDLTRTPPPPTPASTPPKKRTKRRQPQNGRIEVEIALREMIAKEFDRRQRVG